MEKCKICGEMFNIWDTSPVNIGEEKFHICGTCLESERDAGRIISCDACGQYSTTDALHDEEIGGHPFTACPACGKDVVDGLTREQFANEYRPIRYAVMVHFRNSTRGYVVSVPVGEGTATVIKKLAEKVDLTGVSKIACAEILLDEDEF